jgi:3-phenylpropionate/trans-cinnamate dioxygenase ferredoxin subunit
MEKILWEKKRMIKKVALIDEVNENGLKVEVDGEEILLLKIKDEVFAINNLCSHQEKELYGGEVDGYTITCPHHGAKFDLKTGKVLSMPAVEDIKIYKVILKDGEVFVESENG